MVGVVALASWLSFSFVELWLSDFSGVVTTPFSDGEWLGCSCAGSSFATTAGCTFTACPGPGRSETMSADWLPTTEPDDGVSLLSLAVDADVPATVGESGGDVGGSLSWSVADSLTSPWEESLAAASSTLLIAADRTAADAGWLASGVTDSLISEEVDGERSLFEPLSLLPNRSLSSSTLSASSAKEELKMSGAELVLRRATCRLHKTL